MAPRLSLLRQATQDLLYLPYPGRPIVSPPASVTTLQTDIGPTLALAPLPLAKRGGLSR